MNRDRGPLVKLAPRFHKEYDFWNTRLTRDEPIRDIGSVDYIDYNPLHLDELLVTSLARSSIYDSNTLEIRRTFKTDTQFQVYGACYRKSDGRLIAAGSEEGKVFVFESQSTNPLRVINLNAPTHRVLFFDNKIASFSDDSAVRILDVGCGSVERTYGDPEDKKARPQTYHNDYIRCGSTINRLIVSGSYDNMVKLWDPRVHELKPIMEYDHGHAVESLCNRGETLLISVGGNKLHIFDLVAGKTLTNIIPRHHKTITCVANYEDKYLLTGALDGYLNVLNFNYEFVTRFNYDEAQILSLSVSPKLVAVGFNDHHICVKRFKDFIAKSNKELAELEKMQSGYFGPNMATRYFHEAIAESQDPAATRRALLAIKQKKTPIVLEDAESVYRPVVVPKPRKSNTFKFSTYERLLMGFHHTKVLTLAIKEHNRDADSLIFVLQELIKRDKLRSSATKCLKVIALIKFISRNLCDVRHNRIFVDSALTLIDVCMDDKSVVDRKDYEYPLALESLYQSVVKELEVIDACAAVAAQLDTIVSHY